MEHLSLWLSPAAVVAVVLFVWRRLDKRIDDLRTESRREMNALRDEMRGEMSGLRDEMRGEMSGLRGEMRGEMSGLRGEMSGLRDEMRGVSERLARLEGAAFGPWPVRSEAETAPGAETDG